jgi:hypothetical protein
MFRVSFNHFRWISAKLWLRDSPGGRAPIFPDLSSVPIPFHANSSRSMACFSLPQLTSHFHLRTILHIRASSRALDDLLDDLLDRVPIICWHLRCGYTKVLHDLLHHLPALLVIHECDGDTNTPETSCSAYAVEISFWVCYTVDFGNVLEELDWGHPGLKSMTYVIDDHRNRLHINTTSEDVGSDQNLCLSGSESVNDPVSFASFERTCQGCNLMTFCCHTPLDLYCCVSSLDIVSMRRMILLSEQTFTKIIDDPIVIRPYSFTSTSNLWFSESQSMYSCLIPSTVSSSCFKVIWLALGANLSA